MIPIPTSPIETARQTLYMLQQSRLYARTLRETAVKNFETRVKKADMSLLAARVACIRVQMLAQAADQCRQRPKALRMADMCLENCAPSKARAATLMAFCGVVEDGNMPGLEGLCAMTANRTAERAAIREDDKAILGTTREVLRLNRDVVQAEQRVDRLVAEEQERKRRDDERPCVTNEPCGEVDGEDGDVMVTPSPDGEEGNLTVNGIPVGPVMMQG